MPPLHEHQVIARIGWLRAAVLGANDGILSTASLLAGIAAGGATSPDLLLAGSAAAIAGALSMAAGEYVSVSSQADSEQAELVREQREIALRPHRETRELVDIYMARGLDQALAQQVADQLMATDPLGAHARDELGFSSILAPRPLQAALASALAFGCGALLPLLITLLAPDSSRVAVIMASTLPLLALLGAVGARAGKAPILRSVVRVTFWGALAMILTAAAGQVVGTLV